MKLSAGLHLASCTNLHQGDTWPELFESLKFNALKVRERVCPDKPFALGMRLGNHAAHQLADRGTLLNFQRWLDRNHLYVFTLNGFCHGHPGGDPTPEQAYTPDWSSPQRLAYTNLLVDLLSQLVPEHFEASVNTLPGSFKGLPLRAEQLKAMRGHLWQCVEHIARVSRLTGRTIHLALDPEPLCLLESSAETLHWFERLRAEHPRDERLQEHLGVNYDTCHFAVEFEEPQDALLCLVRQGIKISKIRLSSALRALPTAEARVKLASLPPDGGLHQVVVRQSDNQRFIYRTIREALEDTTPSDGSDPSAAEWRIHLHIPLHRRPAAPLDSTVDHVHGVLDVLETAPGICSQLELGCQVWDLSPPEFQPREAIDHLVAEYEWTLAQLAERGLA